MLGVITLIGAGALVVEKVVEFVRSAVETKWHPSTFWYNLLALALGVAYAVGWKLDYTGAVLAQIPATVGMTLSESTGRVLTGLAIGAASGFWWAIFQALKATVTRNEAVAVSAAPIVKTK